MKNKTSGSKKSYKKYGNQVRISNEWWKILSHLKLELGIGFKPLIEDALDATYGVDKNGKPFQRDYEITKRGIKRV